MDGDGFLDIVELNNESQNTNSVSRVTATDVGDAARLRALNAAKLERPRLAGVQYGVHRRLFAVGPRNQAARRR